MNLADGFVNLKFRYMSGSHQRWAGGHGDVEVKEEIVSWLRKEINYVQYCWGEGKKRTGMCPLYLAIWRILVTLKKNSFTRMVEAAIRAVEEWELGEELKIVENRKSYFLRNICWMNWISKQLTGPSVNRKCWVGHRMSCRIGNNKGQENPIS